MGLSSTKDVSLKQGTSVLARILGIGGEGRDPGTSATRELYLQELGRLKQKKGSAMSLLADPSKVADCEMLALVHRGFTLVVSERLMEDGLPLSPRRVAGAMGFLTDASDLSCLYSNGVLPF